jgi:hypothetical protein
MHPSTRDPLPLLMCAAVSSRPLLLARPETGGSDAARLRSVRHVLGRWLRELLAGCRLRSGRRLLRWLIRRLRHRGRFGPHSPGLRRRSITAAYRKSDADARRNGDSRDRGGRALVPGRTAKRADVGVATNMTTASVTGPELHAAMVDRCGVGIQAHEHLGPAKGRVRSGWMSGGDGRQPAALSCGFTADSSLRSWRSASFFARRRFCLRRRGPSCGWLMPLPLPQRGPNESTKSGRVAFLVSRTSRRPIPTARRPPP